MPQLMLSLLLSVLLAPSALAASGDDPAGAPEPTIPARIDVEPGSIFNEILLTSQESLRVAILGSDELDVTWIDPESVAFGPEGARPRFPLENPGVFLMSLAHVNADEQLDLVAHFRVQETGLAAGDSRACLSGSIDGVRFRACDGIQIRIFVSCGLGFELALLVPPLAWLRTRRGRGSQPNRAPRSR